MQHSYVFSFGCYTDCASRNPLKGGAWCSGHLIHIPIEWGVGRDSGR